MKQYSAARSPEGFLELAEDLLGVLFPQDADHHHQLGEAEGLVDGLGGDPDAFGVVRGVHDDGRRGAQHLEAAGRGDRGEGLLHHLGVERLFRAEEGLQRGDRDGGVLGLVRAVQRHQQVLVAARDALDGDHLAADGDGAGFDAELDAFEAERDVGFLGLFQQHLGRVRGAARR